MMFKILVLQVLYNLSNDQAEFQIADRLYFMWFLGLSLGEKVLDVRTIRLFRQHLVVAGAIDKMYARFYRHLEKSGYLAMGGQIVDATVVAAPRQRNSNDEKKDLKAGKTPQDWAE